jgi:hypothetical protein
MGFHCAVTGASHDTFNEPFHTRPAETFCGILGVAVEPNVLKRVGMCKIPAPQPVHCVLAAAAYFNAALIFAGAPRSERRLGYFVSAAATAADTIGADELVP